MMSACLDRKEECGAIWGLDSTGTDQPVATYDGFFCRLAGWSADWISSCLLDRVLTYKHLIYFFWIFLMFAIFDV